MCHGFDPDEQKDFMADQILKDRQQKNENCHCAEEGWAVQPTLDLEVRSLRERVNALEQEVRGLIWRIRHDPNIR